MAQSLTVQAPFLLQKNNETNKFPSKYILICNFSYIVTKPSIHVMSCVKYNDNINLLISKK